MSYPEKGAKYAGQDRASKLCRAEGGGVSFTNDEGISGTMRDSDLRAANLQSLQSRNAPPTDPTVSLGDVKTWGSADNARAAARARENAAKNPIPESEKMRIQQQMSKD